MTAIYRRPERETPHKSGFIFIHHLAAANLCAKGSRQFFLNCKLSKKEVSDFFKNGMPIEEFEARFGRDAMAQQAIAKAREDHG